MNFAKKLREVVASNFIEIARADEDVAAPRPAVEEPRPIPDSSPAAEMTASDAPAAVADAPSPPAATIPPHAEFVPAADWTGQDLIDFVGADGAVDFDRVLARADLPRVGFTAEQAAKVLAALPNDLPMQVKRLTLKATLEAVDRNAVIDPQDVVADAMLKKVHVAQFRDALRSYVETRRQENAAEIVRLQAQIERLKAATDTTEQKRLAAENACDERMALMEQVVVFFQSEAIGNVSGAQGEPAADDEELPAFMRDDSVFRMLGLEPAAGSAEASATDEDPMTVAGKTRKRTGRFAVADNVEA